MRGEHSITTRGTVARRERADYGSRWKGTTVSIDIKIDQRRPGPAKLENLLACNECAIITPLPHGYFLPVCLRKACRRDHSPARDRR